jgi:pyruvate/2-oxoglutarate dehydrogenase complex dihydrolipoamide acyltransferase (E2) component
VLFEDKVLYTERMFPAGELDSRFEASPVTGGDWIHLRRRGGSGPPVMLVAPGGVGRRALAAADRLAVEDGLDAQVLVPLRLYPLDVEPVLELLAAAAGVWVAEEGTAGGTWGSQVASTVHELVWPRLARPVRSVSSADSIIPAAPHLEADVLLSADTIVAAVRAGMRTAARTPAGAAAGTGAAGPAGPAGVGVGPGVVAPGLPVTGRPVAAVADQTGPAPIPGSPDGVAVPVPKLNNNDDEYVLTAWAVADGDAVGAGQAVADVETSKATEELVADADGMLRQLLPAGSTCRPGDVIARIVPPSAAAGGPASASAGAPADAAAPAPAGAPAAAPADGPAQAAPDGAAELHVLSRVQRRVADVVSTSHREIPAAFVAARVLVDRASAAAVRRSAESGAELGLVELVVVALGRLQPRFPLLFGSLRPDGTVLVRETVSVGVTVDVGTGLSVPVLHDVARRSADEIADALTELRMRALRGRLTEQDLTGGSIAVSVNTDEDITLVQPIIPPGMVAAVSLTGGHEQVVANRSGGFAVRRVVDVGLAHDHRVVNGREAAAFLLALKALLEEPEQLLPAGD